MALQDKERVVRWSAAAALGSIGPAAKGAVPALLEAWKEGADSGAVTALQALGQIGPEAKSAVPDLIGVLTRHKCVVAAQALGKMGPAAKLAVPALLEAVSRGKDYHDWELQSAAAAALNQIDPETAKRALQGP
jgi:HEAT repeat protein